MKKNKGITLMALVITIIVLIILAGITITLLIKNDGILSKTKIAKEETNKTQAEEIMNLKITNIQMESYAKNLKLPNLQYLADKLCEDNDMEYVLKASKKNASLDKIDVNNISSIYTKLKKYPYEFEINSSLQLASIDGIKISNVEESDKVVLTTAQYNDILNRLNALEEKNTKFEEGIKLKDATIIPSGELKELVVNKFCYNSYFAYMHIKIRLKSDFEPGATINIGKIQNEESKPIGTIYGLGYNSDRGIVLNVGANGNISIRNIGTSALTVKSTDNNMLNLYVTYPYNRINN